MCSYFYLGISNFYVQSKVNTPQREGRAVSVSSKLHRGSSKEGIIFPLSSLFGKKIKLACSHCVFTHCVLTGSRWCKVQLFLPYKSVYKHVHLLLLLSRLEVIKKIKKTNHKIHPIFAKRTFSADFCCELKEKLSSVFQWKRDFISCEHSWYNLCRSRNIFFPISLGFVSQSALSPYLKGEMLFLRGRWTNK